MVIILSMPPSINATYKRSKFSFYKSAEAKTWEEMALWDIRRQWKGETILEEVELTIYFYFKRERDICSGIKILEDILQKGGVYKNDSQIYKETIYKKFDKENPRVEVIISLLTSNI